MRTESVTWSGKLFHKETTNGNKRQKQIVCTGKWSGIVKNMITGVREMTFYKIPQ